MMQRKGIPRSFSNASYFHGSGALLPVTQNDRKTVPGSSRFLRRRNNGNGTVTDGAIGSISLSTVGKVVSIITIILVTATIIKNVAWGSPATEELLEASSSSSSSSAKAAARGLTTGGGGGGLGAGGGLRNQYWQTLDEQKLPLSEYPSIQYALDHSDIVLLYFAASWCKMSTPITELLDEKFGDILLPPETSGIKLHNKQRRPISLVYISSDESEEQMNKYSRKNWITIPFHSEERANLKKHFKVAAKRELEVLNMERMYEIPSIIIVSGESHNVVTTHGVDDLKEKGSEALIHWIKLLHTVKSLEDKYY